MVTWNAEDYAESSKAQAGWAVELMNRIPLDGHEHLLDLGCGDGRITALLADRVHQGSVVGLDQSPEMVALAQEAYANRSPHLTFIERDVADLDFHNEFDLIFSNACLHWAPDHQPVMDGIARALRPGGRAMLSMGGRGNAQPVRDTLSEVISRPNWSEYFQDFTFPYSFLGPNDYAPMLQNAGLSADRIELVDKDMVHTPDDFEGWFRTTWIPYIQRVPEPNRPQFIAEAMEQYRTVNPIQDDGLVHTPMVRLEVAATAG